MKALCLSGGGSKGAWQAGAIKYLVENGYTFDVVAGVSAGAMNAIMIGQDEVDEMTRIWAGLKNHDVYSGKLKSLRTLWNIITGKPSIFDSKPLKKLLDSKVDISKVKKIIHFGTVCLDTGEYVDVVVHDGTLYFKIGDVPIKMRDEMGNRHTKELLMASSTIPIIWPPIEYACMELVDGGVRNLTPLKSVIQHNPEEIVIINCNPRGLEGYIGSNLFDVANRSLSIAMNEIFINDMREFLRINFLVKQAQAAGTDLRRRDGSVYKYFHYTIIEPSSDLGNSMDFNKGGEKIRGGYRDAKRIIDPGSD